MVDSDTNISNHSNGKIRRISSRISGIWQSFQNVLYAIFILCAVLLAAMALTRYMISLPDRNDSDPANGYSGLAVLVDSKTGCQYLGTRNGGITPRLDKKGKHICGDN